MRSKRRIIEVKVLPSNSTNGIRRVCIHLFVPDERGLFVEPHALHPATDELGKLIPGQVVAKPTRGRLACDPKRLVAPVTKGNVTTITHRTDDPRAVTCPRCVASEDYTTLMATLGEKR